jgi:hypothetical protein
MLNRHSLIFEVFSADSGLSRKGLDESCWRNSNSVRTDQHVEIPLANPFAELDFLAFSCLKTETQSSSLFPVWQRFQELRLTFWSEKVSLELDHPEQFVILFLPSDDSFNPIIRDDPLVH